MASNAAAYALVVHNVLTVFGLDVYITSGVDRAVRYTEHRIFKTKVKLRGPHMLKRQDRIIASLQFELDLPQTQQNESLKRSYEHKLDHAREKRAKILAAGGCYK